MKKINIGIIGYGYMGKMHSMCYENLKYYYEIPDVKINLYAVVTSKKQEDLDTKFEKVYKTYQELLEDKNVDAVSMCLPNFMHKEVIMECLKMKKHIYCEKPLALNLKEGEEILEYMNEISYNKVNRMVFEYRFVPAIMRAKDLIEKGKIGNLINFNMKYYGSEYLNPEKPISWQSTKEKSGGGVLYALGSHAVDLILYLIGDVEEIYAQKNTLFKKRKSKETKQEVKVEIEDLVNVQMKLKNNILGNLTLSQVAAGSGIDLEFEIYGDKGTIKFNHEDPNTLKYFSLEDEEKPYGGMSGFKNIQTLQRYEYPAKFPPPRVNISWIRYHMDSQFNFINAIVNNESVTPDIYSGFKVQEVMSKIFESSNDKKPKKI